MTDAFCRELLCRDVSRSSADASQYDPAKVVLELQLLFTHLLGSRRAYLEPETFHKALLKEPWGDKRQQDAYQFLLYLFDCIGAVPQRHHC
jgi:hypothetical protein